MLRGAEGLCTTSNAACRCESETELQWGWQPETGRNRDAETQPGALQACGALAWCGFGVCVRGKKKKGRDMGGTAVRGGKSEERLKGNINSKKRSGDGVAIAEGKKGEVKQGSRQEESQEKPGAGVWFGLLL